MTDDSAIPVQSEKGKQILAYAFSEGDCILEFQEQDGGELIVMDITDHVRQLERKVDNA